MDRYCWITAQTDRTEHAVSDEAQGAARRGAYEGLCGQEFLAASMDVGPQQHCGSCRAFLDARVKSRSMTERMNRRTWFARLCSRGRHAA
jgi:hypothetical protein